jgi:hypothetical protein
MAMPKPPPSRWLTDNGEAVIILTAGCMAVLHYIGLTIYKYKECGERSSSLIRQQPVNMPY